MSPRVALSSLFLLVVTAGCASAPPAPPAPVRPTFTFEQKTGWILYLEDARVLRDNQPVAVAMPAAQPVPGRKGSVAPPPPEPVYPDLLELLEDADARVRRRAAIAVGRVGLTEGAEPLQALLKDPDTDVRQMAAFGLGLIGERATSTALVAALGDEDWRVRGRAAEALGRVGDPATAAAVGQLATAARDSGKVASVAIDDLGWPLAPEVEAFRLSVYALVRLKSWDALAAAVLDASGQPVVRWWPVAYALQRIEDPRALPALLAFAAGTGADAQAFAARGLGVLKDPKAVDALLRCSTRERTRPAWSRRRCDRSGRLVMRAQCRPLRRSCGKRSSTTTCGSR